MTKKRISGKSRGKSRKTYNAITFRPDDGMKAMIEKAKARLRMGKSEIVRICVEKHLPYLIQEQYKQAQSLLEEFPAAPKIVDSLAPNSATDVLEGEAQKPDAGEPPARGRGGGGQSR